MHYAFYKNAWENYNKMQFPGVGKYDIPQMDAVDFLPGELLKFNYKGNAKDPARAALHFFMWDHLFMSVWHFPERHIESFKKFGAVIAPNFSLFYDFPKALQILAHYRTQWIGAYWQAHGVNVIPCVEWSGLPDCWEFCFDGVPKNSTIAVQATTAEVPAMLTEGWAEMLRVCKPSRILVYGCVPDELKADNVICYEPFVEQYKKSKRNKVK